MISLQKNEDFRNHKSSSFVHSRIHSCEIVLYLWFTCSERQIILLLIIIRIWLAKLTVYFQCLEGMPWWLWISYAIISRLFLCISCLQEIFKPISDVIYRKLFLGFHWKIQKKILDISMRDYSLPQDYHLCWQLVLIWQKVAFCIPNHSIKLRLVAVGLWFNL